MKQCLSWPVKCSKCLGDLTAQGGLFKTSPIIWDRSLGGQQVLLGRSSNFAVPRLQSLSQVICITVNLLEIDSGTHPQTHRNRHSAGGCRS